ncbi:uncharacterized protein Z519_06471 [Cladophialophora bantiana CBS 173.52]|uniref:Heterokaryon incompatibility domain-containing protein n=1 Tax=Cladophialophora bantiana (strain ATCC 10958 / CBS 173.52 / CDC B-1940 / NIH 8579) TaxID=1442370 RepID=A0A0D2I6Z8_CLAB1|nr:uncharacterized protein Z519_06471 [Cladophialophora bantiana CBS 173.52]KIW92624.1 hypothetical protein Z519_06471 [Cladophialophora bantiana CBS 173.52]
MVDLFQTGSLEKVMEELPQTIPDAIEFVFDFGEEYLWVDALCILPDCNDDKQFQLSQMDRVYGSALLTLVSAALSTDLTTPQLGLPRYRETTQWREPWRDQEVLLVQNLHLLVPFESLISTIDHSRWSTRAWTYQERLLSRRMLFFTNSQVYFQCSCNVFCEDADGEGVLPCAYMTPVGNLWNPGAPYSSDAAGWQFGSLHLSRQLHIPVEYAPREDESIVCSYRARNLSFPQDVLNALRGIQNILQESVDTNFWYGMPERCLDKVLLWTLTGPPERLLKSTGESEQGKLLSPSWSWARWNSRMEIGSYFADAGIYDVGGISEFPQNGNRDVQPTQIPRETLELNVRPRSEIDVTGEDWANPDYLA